MKIVNIEPTINKLKELYKDLNISQQYVVDSIICELESLPNIRTKDKYITKDML